MDSYKDRQHPGSDGLDRALTDLYRIQTPQGFDAAWRGAVRREELKQMKPSAKGRIWRAALPAFGALVLVVGTLLTGAGELGALPDRPESAAAPMAGNRAAKLEAYDGGGSSASQSMDNAYEGGASGGYGLTEARRRPHGRGRPPPGGGPGQEDCPHGGHHFGQHRL